MNFRQCIDNLNLGMMEAFQNKTFAHEFEFTFDLKAILKDIKEDKMRATKN